MEAKDILTFLFQRADATQTFWNLFATVATAILGFVAAAKVEWLTKITRGVLTLGFVIFAIANLQALNEMRAQREGLIAFLPTTSGYTPSLNNVVVPASPPTLYELLLFHLTLDFVVVVMIWLIPRIRKQHSGSDDG